MIIKNHKFLPLYGLFFTLILVMTSISMCMLIQNLGGNVIMIISVSGLLCITILNGFILMRSIRHLREMRRRAFFKKYIENMPQEKSLLKKSII